VEQSLLSALLTISHRYGAMCGVESGTFDPEPETRNTMKPVYNSCLHGYCICLSVRAGAEHRSCSECVPHSPAALCRSLHNIRPTPRPTPTPHATYHHPRRHFSRRSASYYLQHLKEYALSADITVRKDGRPGCSSMHYVLVTANILQCFPFKKYFTSASKYRLHLEQHFTVEYGDNE
jgi:hypothetical protein